jgi:hypothetical protein
MTNKHNTQLLVSLEFIGIAVWAIFQFNSMIITFSNQNIWDRWTFVFIFSAAVGILFPYAGRRFFSRFCNPLYPIGWFGSIAGLAICFIISGYQMNYPCSILNMFLI